jgi:hypothetical protein
VLTLLRNFTVLTLLRNFIVSPHEFPAARWVKYPQLSC